MGRHGLGRLSPHVDRSLRDRMRVSERLAHVCRSATRHRLWPLGRHRCSCKAKRTQGCVRMSGPAEKPWLRRKVAQMCREPLRPNSLGRSTWSHRARRWARTKRPRLLCDWLAGPIFHSALPTINIDRRVVRCKPSFAPPSDRDHGAAPTGLPSRATRSRLPCIPWSRHCPSWCPSGGCPGPYRRQSKGQDQAAGTGRRNHWQPTLPPLACILWLAPAFSYEIFVVD